MPCWHFVLTSYSGIVCLCSECRVAICFHLPCWPGKQDLRLGLDGVFLCTMSTVSGSQETRVNPQPGSWSTVLPGWGQGVDNDRFLLASQRHDWLLNIKEQNMLLACHYAMWLPLLSSLVFFSQPVSQRGWEGRSKGVNILPKKEGTHSQMLGFPPLRIRFAVSTPPQPPQLGKGGSSSCLDSCSLSSARSSIVFSFGCDARRIF